MTALPTALLLDLDDTILDAYSDPDEAWRQLCSEFAGDLGDVAAEEVHAAILDAREWLWVDPERARRGRLDLPQARRDIVSRAFARLGISDTQTAGRMADRYSTIREEAVRPFPGAVDTLQRLKEDGIRLGLMTNGASKAQRGKIDRFSLDVFFDHIQIEEEFGIGKPDGRAFRHALNVLGVGPDDAWMVGDDLELDIRGAQQAGIHAVWIDPRGEGLPDGATVRPDRTIGSLSDLVA